MKQALLALLWIACGPSQEPAVGVSTAPQSVPRPAPIADDAAPVPAATASAAPEPPDAAVAAVGRLHAVTGMTLEGKKLDAKAVVSRIEATPAALDACSALAAQEPNGPDGSWNAKLTIRAGKASVQMQSPVRPAFEACVAAAAAQWSLERLGTGEMLLLLGVTQ